MRKAQERAPMKGAERVKRVKPRDLSTRALRDELTAARAQAVAPGFAAASAPAEVTRKISATVLAKVRLRALKTVCPTGLKGNVVRFILVPDFEAINGSHGFRQLLPHLLDLRPALICIKATDVWKAKADDDLRDALQELPDNLSCWAVFDRLPEAGFQQVNGFRGFVDPIDGRMKTGIIMVPESDETGDDIDQQTEDSTLASSCKLTHVNVPWASPVFHESMAGYAFQKAGYVEVLERDGKKYLAAMPHNYHQSEVIVVDAIGSGEVRKD
jgi:hypothetical protein